MARVTGLLYAAGSPGGRRPSLFDCLTLLSTFW